MVLGNYKSRLSTTYLDGLRLPEKKKLLDTVVEFVLRVRDFKEAVYAPKRAESLARKEAYEARQKDAAAAAKEKTATAVVLTEAMDSQESAL
jgi:hypothetical protein